MEENAVKLFDIKPALLGPSWVYWLAEIAAALVVLALVFWLVRKFQRRRQAAPMRTETSAPALAQLSPQELFQHLQTLAPQAPNSAEQLNVFALTAKAFLQSRFGFPASALTGQEMRLFITAQVPIAAEAKSKLADFFQNWELIAYGILPLDAALAAASVRETMSWLQACLPTQPDLASP